MSICSQLQLEYSQIKSLKAEYDLQYQTAKGTGDLSRLKELRLKLEQKRNSLQDKLWPFAKEIFSREKFNQQYDRIISGYRELGILIPLSSGKEGIKDQAGIEYPIISAQEILSDLKKNKEFYTEKFATLQNPRIHLTPFALSPENLKEKYAKEIEDHFVELRTEGDRRIPDPAKTKLFGFNADPLELRTDRKNVYSSTDLETLTYFPEWKGNKPKNGLSKQQAIKEIGGWQTLILEDNLLAPRQGQAKTITTEIKVKDKKGRTTTKEVSRTQVEGGLDTAQQYARLKAQNEQGLTLEDYISYAMLKLRENNVVLDDDRKYYCRLLGVATASGSALASYWDRSVRRSNLSWVDPKFLFFRVVVRGAVRVKRLGA